MAIVLSIEEFQRLQQPRRDIWDVVRDFRARHAEELDADPDEIFAIERDPSPGPDFSWPE